MLFTSAISVGNKFRAMVLTQRMRTLIKTYSSSTGSSSGPSSGSTSGSSSESSSGSSSDSSSDSDSDTENVQKTKPVENPSTSSLDAIVESLITMKPNKTKDVAMPVRKIIKQDRVSEKKTNLSHETQLTQAVLNITNNLSKNKEEVKTQLLDSLSNMYENKKNTGSLSKDIENVVLDNKSSSDRNSNNIHSNEQWKYKANVARKLQKEERSHIRELLENARRQNYQSKMQQSGVKQAHDKSKYQEQQKEEKSHIKELLENARRQNYQSEMQQSGVKQAHDKSKYQKQQKEEKSHIKELLENKKRQKYKLDQERIFENMKEPTTTIPELSTWNFLEKKELDLIASHYPRNIFEEMIQWTESGKLWKFPIDNEIGMEKEYSVHFSEHIFLERHLKDWCPKTGPIRHFMELVCVGLSKNPYMTVDEKIGHIAWYKEYFDGKKEILLELGAIQTSSATTKEITT